MEETLEPCDDVARKCLDIAVRSELGPNRWVPAVLEAGGMAGILVLVWINGLMAVMRYRAGDVVHRASPTGLLLASAVISGVGLLALSYASGIAMTFAAATVFALGVCYFWPTMLGVVSERVPRSGAINHTIRLAASFSERAASRLWLPRGSSRSTSDPAASGPVAS